MRESEFSQSLRTVVDGAEIKEVKRRKYWIKEVIVFWPCELTTGILIERK